MNEVWVAETDGIWVQVEATYLPERSSPTELRYLFAYRIRILNRGEETAQLMDRYWLITDGNGETEEVEGPGVVGNQPVLGPGEAFEYTSFCPLPTEVGTMEGHYRMQRDSGEVFLAEVPRFTLALPHAVN
jgi:ApaG protein